MKVIISRSGLWVLFGLATVVAIGSSVIDLRSIRAATYPNETANSNSLLGNTAEGKDRIFELRTYYAAKGKMPALLKRFRDHTTKLFEKHGMTNIGYWVDSKDPEGKLIYIVAHASKEAAEKSWKAFRDDPDWQKAYKASEVNGKLVDKLESVYMNPTDFSALK